MAGARGARRAACTADSLFLKDAKPSSCTAPPQSHGIRPAGGGSRRAADTAPSFDRFVRSTGAAPIPYGRTLHALIQVGGLDRGESLCAVTAVRIKLEIAKYGTPACNSLAKEYGFHNLLC